LAGDFTEGSIRQLKSQGFTVLHFSYDTIIAAFKREGLNVAFDESTLDAKFQKYLSNLEKCPPAKIQQVKENLLDIHKKAVREFLRSLEQKLSNVIDKVIIVPLYGETGEFASIKQAAAFIDKYSENSPVGEFKKYEILVRFSNQDKIEAEFSDKQAIQNFLRYLSTTFVSG
jgi:hypothetical protein